MVMRQRAIGNKRFDHFLLSGRITQYLAARTYSLVRLNM